MGIDRPYAFYFIILFILFYESFSRFTTVISYSARWWLVWALPVLFRKENTFTLKGLSRMLLVFTELLKSSCLWVRQSHWDWLRAELRMWCLVGWQNNNPTINYVQGPTLSTNPVKEKCISNRICKIFSWANCILDAANNAKGEWQLVWPIYFDLYQFETVLWKCGKTTSRRQ